MSTERKIVIKMKINNINILKMINNKRLRL